MGKTAGLFKRIKHWIDKDKNKYLIYNDPSLLDPYRGLPEQFRPDRQKLPREVLEQLNHRHRLK